MWDLVWRLDELAVLAVVRALFRLRGRGHRRHLRARPKLGARIYRNCVAFPITRTLPSYYHYSVQAAGGLLKHLSNLKRPLPGFVDAPELCTEQVS
jgi:hypothetical protein